MVSSPFTDAGGRLNAITIGGTGVADNNVVEAVTSAALSLSTTQVQQLTLEIVDPTYVLRDGNYGAKGQSVTFSTHRFAVAVRGTSANGTQPQLDLTCRDAGSYLLKGAAFQGPLSRSSISPTEFLRLEAQAAGLSFVGQPTAARTTIVRQSDTTTHESSWDVGVRLAGEEGFLFFAIYETVYFCRPSWLVANYVHIPVAWPGDLLTNYPQLRDSDAQGSGVTGTLMVPQPQAFSFVPGTIVDLTGMGPYSGAYLVTDLQVNLAKNAPASLSIAQPIDPVPTGDPAASAG